MHQRGRAIRLIGRRGQQLARGLRLFQLLAQQARPEERGVEVLALVRHVSGEHFLGHFRLALVHPHRGVRRRQLAAFRKSLASRVQNLPRFGLLALVAQDQGGELLGGSASDVAGPELLDPL